MKVSFWNILRNAFYILTFLLAAFVLFLLCTGTRSFAVQSDSMAPTFRKGDVVCVRQVDFSTLREGDVISARFPESDGVFTHRIVSIDAEKQQVRTRGDSNAQDDPQPTDASRIIGRYWFSIPYVGQLSLHLQDTNIPIYVLLGVAFALIVLRIGLSLRKKTNG